MSGTSLDGVDVALIDTDGKSFVHAGPGHYLPYPDDLKAVVRACFGKMQADDETRGAERGITDAHARAVNEFMAQQDLKAADISVIGFHGQTITHKPRDGFTWQLGDGARLSRATGIDVVNDFRVADVRAGGEGAPLIPLYHQALARAAKVKLPAVLLNIGGVANVTWIGEKEDDILAFDTGPGNALMDDFMRLSSGRNYDFEGKASRAGTPDQAMIAAWLDHAYLKKVPPKSLDRGFVPEKGQGVPVNADMNVWDVSGIWDLSPEDAMATLAHLTAETIAASRAHFPAQPREWYVCGGGRHNLFLMEILSAKLGVPVRPINDLGYNGDTIEAEGFAYLAARHLQDLPLSLPTTTGVSAPVKGGVFHPK